MLILFSFSFCFFVFAWIFSYIYEKVWILFIFFYFKILISLMINKSWTVWIIYILKLVELIFILKYNLIVLLKGEYIVVKIKSNEYNFLRNIVYVYNKRINYNHRLGCQNIIAINDVITLSLHGSGHNKDSSPS